MKLNAVKFKDRASFEKNKKKSNVVDFYDNYDVIVFKDNTYVKPDKTKVSHVEQIQKVEYGVPRGRALLKATNHHIGLAACSRFKIKILKEFPKTKTIIVEIPEHMPYRNFHDLMMGTNSFYFIEPDIIIPKKTHANITYDNHWQLVAIDAQSAWDEIQQNPPPGGVVVTVIDIGCQTDHPDLVGQIVTPLNVITDTTDVMPPDPFANHGTCCSGLIAANPTNNLDTIGVGGVFTKVSFVNVGTMVDTLSFASSTGDKVQAINHAIDIPNCCAISMSYGGDNFDQFEEDALVEAQTIGRGGKGIVCCASAGNDGQFNLTQYPAYYQGVLSIAALDFNDFDYTRAGYSNYGVNIFGAAPASGTPATDRTGAAGYNSAGDITYFSGTSAACPVFAGVVSLINAANPNLTQLQIQNVIKESSIQVGGYNYSQNPIYPGRSYDTGYGMIHAGNAVALALGGSVSPDPAIPINFRVTVAAASLVFPGTNLSVVYTVICNKIITVDTTIAVTIFKSANNVPALEPADTVLTTVNITIPANQYRYQGTYTFLVDNSWVGLNYIGVYAQSQPGETYTIDNYGFRSLQVIGETPPPNLNLKARIQQITLSSDGTKVLVYFDIVFLCVLSSLVRI